MNMEDEEFSPYGGFGSGCEIHGEDYLRECTMCGVEFCSACFPNSALCSDCAAQGDLDGDLEEESGSDEEKDLLLIEGFDEEAGEAEGGEKPPAIPPAPTMAKSGKKSGPAQPAKPAAGKTSVSQVKSQAVAKPKIQAKPKSTARVKAKAAKPKSRKPAPAASKTKAQAKAPKKR